MTCQQSLPEFANLLVLGREQRIIIKLSSGNACFFVETYGWRSFRDIYPEWRQETREWPAAVSREEEVSQKTASL